MEIVVDISDTEMDKIVKRAKDEVREEITEEKLKDYLYNSNDINIIEILADFNVYKRCENLNDKNTIIGRPTGGSISIDGASGLRRTCQLPFVVED